MSKIGRNQPCPCGSGKKYKQCCLRGPSESAPRQSDGLEAVGLALDWLQGAHYEALEFSFEFEFLKALELDPESLDEDLNILLNSNGLEWCLASGRTPASEGRIPLMDLVLGYGGPELTAAQRRVLVEMRRAPLTLYKIIERERGRMLCREVVAPAEGVDPREHWVRSPSLFDGDLGGPGTVLGLRLIPGPEWTHTGALYYFPPSWLPGVEDAIRDAWARQDLAEDERIAVVGYSLVVGWLKILGDRPPNLIDGETGDPVVLIFDHFGVHSVSELEDLLASETALKRTDPEEDDETKLVHWTRYGATGSGGEQKVQGTFVLDPEAETFTCLSRTENRADDNRRWIEALAGDLVSFETRNVRDPDMLWDATAEDDED